MCENLNLLREDIKFARSSPAIQSLCTAETSASYEMFLNVKGICHCPVHLRWHMPETMVPILQVERKNDMTLETILIWVVIGAVAGVLAQSMVGGTRGGLGTAILVGILGAFIGGWLFSALGIAIGGGIIGTIVTAFIGAVVLLLLVRGVRRF
jgi:uncharacterized membrane protein YeaQ/YmgE (transglycosylase-associated protein family)